MKRTHVKRRINYTTDRMAHAARTVDDIFLITTCISTRACEETEAALKTYLNHYK